MNIELRQFIGEYDWGWVKQRVDIHRVEDTCGIMAVDLDTNTTVAACILDSWTPNSVQGHMVIDNSLVLRHQFLECCANYIYDVRGVKYVMGVVPDNNKKAIKMNKHMGYTVIAEVPDVIEDGCGVVIMQLTKENCTFLY
tara:strand:- start:5486 stop:5905 length:420 start_codon:yes stop_codon:yes gene_type:complete